MGDYCNCNNGTNCGEGNARFVRLKFLRSELLYDIKNYAFIEADVMGEDKQHAQHVLADIGEDGNVDRVSRILSVVHSDVIEKLYPYTKQMPIEEEVDDKLLTPEEYVIEMQVPDKVSRTTVLSLSRLIHEYMVYSVLADWLSITNPQAAAKWSEKADAMAKSIKREKNTRGVLTRKTHPW